MALTSRRAFDAPLSATQRKNQRALTMIVAFENWQSTRNPKPLASGEVHLWRANLDVSPEMRVILSHDDWIEARRFHYEDERERFIATRGLLRLILARYLAASPCTLRFGAGAD